MKFAILSSLLSKNFSQKFALFKEQFIFADIDECASSWTNDCAAKNANCRNNVGSYTCECKEGKYKQL